MTSSAETKFEFHISVAVQTCDRCQTAVRAAVSECEACGSPVQITDPREIGTNKEKLQALGDLLPELERVATIAHGSGDSAIGVTDEQLVAWCNRNDIFARLQMYDIRTAVETVDLTSGEAIHSQGTRDAFEGLVGGAQDIRRLYDELHAVTMPLSVSFWQTPDR